ncbi:hypothetical protein TWF730_001599 [Orbilia blumenaviensis]|uniref:Nucleoside phosphorylase domain-containing protein n=1 Tax=Orbilia blumenaviensis TaxID=1796055 RepID=A0AAV9UIY2_9PEZI
MAAKRTPPKPDYKSYTVGWIAILESELNAASLLLDEEHAPLPRKQGDVNSYVLGRMGHHNIVIGFTGHGVYGTNAAANTVTNMLRTFPNIKFGLLVGVGGGVPAAAAERNPYKDVRLGDVVVSQPNKGNGAVIQYDMGKLINDEEFVIQSHLNNPPTILLNAVQLLASHQTLGKGRMGAYLKTSLTKASQSEYMRDYYFPGHDQDHLFRSDYRHQVSNSEDCSQCSLRMAVQRLPRQSSVPSVHYGVIASANTVMRSAAHRDRLRDMYHIACFEMEAAGLMDNFPCLVIRGICDYSDDHKNKVWQPYAAMAAASYARDLLRVIDAEEVGSMEPAKVPAPTPAKVPAKVPAPTPAKVPAKKPVSKPQNPQPARPAAQPVAQPANYYGYYQGGGGVLRGQQPTMGTLWTPYYQYY